MELKNPRDIAINFVLKKYFPITSIVQTTLQKIAPEDRNMQQTEVTDHLNMHWRKFWQNREHIWFPTLWASNCNQNQARDNLILSSNFASQPTMHNQAESKGAWVQERQEHKRNHERWEKTNKGIGPNSPTIEMLIPMPQTAEIIKWRRACMRPPAHDPCSNAAWIDHPKVRANAERRRGGETSNA